MSTSYARIRTQRATGTGVEHWKMQRLTAIANVVLVVWFLFAAVGMAGADYLGWVAFFKSPWNAGLMIALVLSAFWHSRLGIQVIIEDYVHTEGIKVAALAGLTVLWALLAVVCVVSIIMLATTDLIVAVEN